MSRQKRLHDDVDSNDSKSDEKNSEPAPEPEIVTWGIARISDNKLTVVGEYIVELSRMRRVQSLQLGRYRGGSHPKRRATGIAKLPKFCVVPSPFLLPTAKQYPVPNIELTYGSLLASIGLQISVTQFPDIKQLPLKEKYDSYDVVSHVSNFLKIGITLIHRVMVFILL